MLAIAVHRGFLDMDRKTRSLVFLSLGLISLLLFGGIAIRVLGVLFLILSAQQILTRPRFR